MLKGIDRYLCREVSVLKGMDRAYIIIGAWHRQRAWKHAQVS